MDTTFTIIEENKSTIAGLGDLQLTIELGIPYYLPSHRGDYQGLWNLLEEFETLVLSTKRNELLEKERNFLREAKSKGFVVVLAGPSPFFWEKGDGELIDHKISLDPFQEQDHSPQRDVAFFFEGSGLKSDFHRRDVQVTISISKFLISSMRKSKSEIEEASYEITKYFPTSGKLYISEIDSIPNWLILQLLKELESKNTSLVILNENRKITAKELEEFRNEIKRRWRDNLPRQVIVLDPEGNRASKLKGAIDAASSYENRSGHVDVDYYKGGDEIGWKWEGAFEKARNTPNVFLVVEDGSVLQRRAMDIRKYLSEIEALGGGLSFAHQSNALFHHLGAGFYILADEPLAKLVEHLKVDSYLDEMSLQTPVNQSALSEYSQNVAVKLKEQGKTIQETSKIMGVNKSTISRWFKTLRGQQSNHEDEN